MVLSREVKDFIKNTLILTLFFTLVLHLSWGYIAPMFGLKSNAGANDLNFQNANINYLGNIATAMSLSVGQRDKQLVSTTIDLTDNNSVSIAEVISNPTVGQQKLIGTNMLAISTYANVLSTDILRLLDSAPDRGEALSEHIALLKSYYTRTDERIKVIDTQISDLGGIVTSVNDSATQAKSVMQSSYVGYDYSGVDVAIDNYIKARNADTQARIYLVYLQKFKQSYQALQSRNLKLLDTLSVNKDPLIKRSTVVIPDSGSDIVKQLKLIQSEADFRANSTKD